MGVTEATTKGGERKQVHSEFDDGYVIGFFDGCDYVPLLFCWDDIYDCPETSILASGDLYHSRLMRTDGGVAGTVSQEIYTFDWSEMTRVPIKGLKNKDGTARYVDGYHLNKGQDTSFYGVNSVSRHLRRLNRHFWTPGDVTQNESGPEGLFGIGQIAHNTCPFDCTDKCHHDTFREDVSNIYRVGEC